MPEMFSSKAGRLVVTNYTENKMQILSNHSDTSNNETPEILSPNSGQIMVV
jgi:hypothetical protein